MSKPLGSLILVALALGGGMAQARGQWHVWTTTHTVRVLREDRPTGQREVRLALARNEWRGFQVLMRSDKPLKGVALQAAELRGPSGATIPATAARLYRQHQLELTMASPRNKGFRPGWYPDPLIPAAHPLTGKPLAGGRYSAMPLDLPAGQTHGFYVDLYVPPPTRPGIYRATYHLTAAGEKPVEIPVTVEVWNFALPETPTVQTALGSPADRMRSYYQRRARAKSEPPPADWAALEAQCAALLSEHRINATPPRDLLVPVERPDGSFRIPAEKIAALRRFVDQYHVNAIQTPHPSSVVRDPVAQADRLRAWLAAWDGAAKELDRPQVVFYTYLKDEPNDAEAYRYVQTWGRAIRQARSALKVLVVEQTCGPRTPPGATYMVPSISGVPCSACISRKALPSGWPWARPCGPIPPCARAKSPHRGGRWTFHCCTTACLYGWPGTTGCAAFSIGAACPIGTRPRTLGPIPRPTAGAKAAKARYITARARWCTRPGRSATRASSLASG